MEQYRPVLKAMYLVGALFVFGALSEPFLQVWPPRFGDVGWRFGAAGLFSGAVVGVAFALAWLLVVALLLSHYRVAMVVAVVSLAMSLVLVLGAVLFALDFGQIRGNVNPQARVGLDVTVMRAFALLVLAVPGTLALGITGLRATRSARRRTRAAETENAGLVYRAKVGAR